MKGAAQLSVAESLGFFLKMQKAGDFDMSPVCWTPSFELNS